LLCSNFVTTKSKQECSKLVKQSKLANGVSKNAAIAANSKAMQA